jgi:hypothetical protein
LLQFADFPREISFGFGAVTAQCAHGDLIGAGRTPEAEIDSLRIEFGQRTEGFGDDQRRMVGQHDAARADPDAAGRSGNVANQHCGRRTGDAGHVVMLGQPVAGETKGLDMLGSTPGNRQRLGDGAAFAHGHEVEHG